MSDKIHVSSMMKQIRDQLSLPEKAYFFDTTLRDGEQTPGISFRLDEKISIARSLDKLGIDVIEAGFPIASEGDFECCRDIAKLGLQSEVIGLARMDKKDIDRVIEADLDSIHVFIATSPLHMKSKLRMTKEEVLERTTEMVEYAKQHYDKILFSAEDATRSNIDFLIKANLTAVDAGATRVNIPDTVGTISPRAFGEVVKMVYEKLPKDIRIAAHCHNDFGLAVANTLAAFENGASEAQTTILGLGERAGNAAFEETCMSLYALYNMPSNINYELIFPTAKLIESYCGGKVKIGRLTPLIGQNAFAHESGIHAHAMLENARAYEPITPALLGIQRTDNFNDIVSQSIKLGKHTGGHALRAKLEDLGIESTDTQFKTIMKRVKAFGDKGHEVTEEDFLAILKDVMGTSPEATKYVKLEELTVLTGSITPTSTVKLKIKNNGDYYEKIASATGVGPVDASVQAIVNCIGEMANLKLLDYKIDAVTGGTEALGHTSIEMMDMETHFIASASSAHEDIVMSSVLSVMKCLNQVLKHRAETN